MHSEVARIAEAISAVDVGNDDGDAHLEDVLRANGEEHLYDQIMRLAVHVEEQPPVIFGWQNVERKQGRQEVFRCLPIR